MTFSELKRQLKKSGCYFHHHGSRHDVWESPITGKQFLVARHDTDEVSKGTLASIKKDAGLK